MFFGENVEVLPHIIPIHRLLEELSKDTKHNYKTLCNYSCIVVAVCEFVADVCW
jgi:hypothetical protein